MILVTGAARSGTSVITSMLQACGANLGNPDNVNDLYENLAIREDLLKPLLQYYGGDRRGQRMFPSGFDKPHPYNIVDSFDAEFGEWGTSVYKDAKLILLWEIFQKELPKCEWLIIRRPVEQIVDSCMRTHFMNSWNTRAEWTQWVMYHEHRIEELKNSVLNYEEVWSNEVLEDPTILKDIVEFYGLDWDENAVRNCINPDKYVT